MKTLISTLFLSTLISTSAYGLSCDDGPSVSVPKNGATDVPVNTQVIVWYSLNTPEEPSLAIVNKTSGEVVESTITAIEDSGGALAFVPNEDLPANTTFYVTREVERTLAGDYTPFATFETGDAVDEVAPISPNIIELTKDHENGPWGTAENVTAVLSIDSDSQADDVLYYRMELADNPDFIDSEFSTIYGTSDSTVVVGSGPCFNTLDREALSVKHVRITAIDMAGNESQVSESAKATGCSSIGVAGMGWLGLSLLPLVIRRRRD